jgi:hypothetical protein
MGDRAVPHADIIDYDLSVNDDVEHAATLPHLARVGLAVGVLVSVKLRYSLFAQSQQQCAIVRQKYHDLALARVAT